MYIKRMIFQIFLRFHSLLINDIKYVCLTNQSLKFISTIILVVCYKLEIRLIKYISIIFNYKKM
jgi:hypothetical protein